MFWLFNLSALLTDDWKVPESFPTTKVASSKFDQLLKSLPAWTVAIGLTGSTNFPEEKVAYEEEALRQICKDMGLELLESLPDNPETNQIFLEESLRSWGILKKFCYKGSVHDLSFKVPFDKLPSMEKLMLKLAKEGNYPGEDMGGYFLILERGRGVHIEFDLHCDLEDKQESWSELTYKKASNYHHKIKQLKDEFDPKGIMNPGKVYLNIV